MLHQIIEFQKGIKELSEKFYTDTGCIVDNVEVINKYDKVKNKEVYLSTEYRISVKGGRQERVVPTGTL